MLRTPLAQDPGVTTMGTQITFYLGTEDASLKSFEMPVPDRVQLGYLTTLARPFTLPSEEIHYKRIARSLLYFATTDVQYALSEQLVSIWDQIPVSRTHLFAAQAGVELLPGGATDGQVADRVLYSQLVHADDARDLLQHVDTQSQQWSLAGMVGDWVAIIAHQQHVLRMVRPDLCPALTAWPGTPTTLFERWGVEFEEISTETPVAESPSHS